MMELELNNITKKFNKVIAVDDVSLQVKPSEMFFLLGPSGCGKTTTLRIIAGLERPNRGTIKIKGKDVTMVPSHKRNLAIVFQRWALFPHKTVYDNIAFGLKMRKMPKEKIKSKVENILGTVGLSGFEDRYPRQLSGGQQQRIALARALVINPTILLLDEPLSNLDLNMRRKMRIELVNLHSQLNITTIFVTHDQTEALSMADRIALMDKGKIMEISTPYEIYESPKTEFTAKFIGERNFIPGKVSLTNKSKVIVESDKGLHLQIPISARAPLSKNDKVNVFIGPEKVEISKKKSVNQENVFSGEIQNVMYLGSIKKYQIILECGEVIICDMQTISDSDILNCCPGEKVIVTLDPQSCVCIPKKAKKEGAY